MGGKLLCKIVQRIETMAGIAALLVLLVVAFHLAVVWGCIETDKFVPDP